MSGKRKVHSPAFKGKVALEALKELNPVNVLSSKYEVQPNQISVWKKQLKDGVSDIFSNKRGKAKKQTEDVEVKLYEEIGSWYSRYVISWRLSNTMDCEFCVEVLDEALSTGTPTIFNTDQGVQFTSKDFIARLEKEKVKISMDGRGRALDNIFVERLWRSVKYEDIYPKDYCSGKELYDGLGNYFSFYNRERPHQSLSYRVPAEVHEH